MNARSSPPNYIDAPRSFAIDIDSNFSLLSAGAAEGALLRRHQDFLDAGEHGRCGVRQSAAMPWWSALNDPTNSRRSATGLGGGGAVRQPDLLRRRRVDSGHRRQSRHRRWRALHGARGCAFIYAGPPGILLLPAGRGGTRDAGAGSIVQLGALVYYLGEDGSMSRRYPKSKPIGIDRVDRYFFENVDQSKMSAIVAAVRSGQPPDRLAVPFRAIAGGNPNVLLIYNWPSTTGPSSASTSSTSSARLTFGLHAGRPRRARLHARYAPFSLRQPSVDPAARRARRLR